VLLTASVSAQGYYYGPHHPKHAPPRHKVHDFYKVKFGITGGVNFANTIKAYNYNNSSGTITGFNAGLMLDIPLAFPVSITPEVLYSEKGYSVLTATGSSFMQHNNYIDVPLLFKFHLAPAFNFLIGPQFSIPVSTSYSNGFTDPGQSSNTPYSSTVLGGVCGISIDLGQNLELRGRYTIDLQPSPQYSYYGSDYRNQVWQVGMAIKF
jgi:hypothetical protein